MTQGIAMSLLGQHGHGPGAGRRATAAAALAAIGGAPGPGEGRPGGPASLYVHVPFCFHKCHYCDFYSLVDRADRQPVFVQRLVDELRALAPFAARPMRTIFVGGGTPTLLRPDLWRTLLAELRRLFDLSLIDTGGGEFTVECNPETASAELFDVLVAGGVDRLSIGAQSFEPAHLKTLERWHDPASVPRALELARAAGIGRRSIDLIYAIPGQTVEQWAMDLSMALSLPIEHLSAYNLTYEPKTAMTRRLEKGEFEPCGEEAEIAMFELTASACAAAGLVRYEVSNYARARRAEDRRPRAAGADARSLHNLAYWRGSQWLAAGPSASGHVAGHRYKNVRAIDDYLAESADGLPPVIDHEGPDAARALSERLMMGLRLSEGLDAGEMLALAGALADGLGPAAGSRGVAERVAERLLREVAWLRDEGTLLSEAAAPGRWVLSEGGMLLADGAARRLMRCVRA